tara:strand:+ start:29 stop:649 length:621 start_codon:yes stop_codon:yes gene_type:complete
MTSNIEHSATIIAAVKAVFTHENNVGIERIKLVDQVKEVLDWREVVSPTKINVDKGASTASKESWTQLMKLSESTLTPADKKLSNMDKKAAEAAKIATGKTSDWAKAQTKATVKLTTLRNQLMKLQDRALYDATDGALTKIEAVSIDGKGEAKEVVEQDILEKGERMAQSYLAFIEKNKDALGEAYKAKRDAAIVMIETSGYKRKV